MSRALLLTPFLLAACSSGRDYDGINDGPPTTVHFTTGAAPVLVVVKDGTASTWQPATQVSPTAYDAVVHGPYLLTVMCKVPSGEQTLNRTYQFARTPEDSTDISAVCGTSSSTAALYSVQGHLAQAGTVIIGNAMKEFPAGDFSLVVPAGTYELYALAGETIAVRHALTVSADVTVPAIDILQEGTALVQEGTALVDLTVEVQNSHVSEFFDVALGNKDNAGILPIAMRINLPDTKGTIKIAPKSVISSRDQQYVSMDTYFGEYVVRPFVEGDSASFNALTKLSAQWPDGKPSVTLDSLDNIEVLTLEAYGGYSPQGADYILKASGGFLSTTRQHEVEVDVDIAGVQPEWKIDPSLVFVRYLTIKQVVDGDLVYRTTMNPQFD